MEKRGSTAIAGVQVEVATDDDQGRIRVLSRILQCLAQLMQPASVFVNRTGRSIATQKCKIFYVLIGNP